MLLIFSSLSFIQFVRRIVRHSLEYLDNGEWKDEEVDAYSQMLSDVIMNANESTAELKVPLGLQLHLVNLFFEELAKVFYFFQQTCQCPCQSLILKFFFRLVEKN